MSGLKTYYNREIRRIHEFFERNGGTARLSDLLEKFGHDVLARFFRENRGKIKVRYS